MRSRGARVAVGLAAVLGLTHCAGVEAEGEAELVQQESALASSTTFGAVADARVEAGAPTTNFGTSGFLRADLSPQTESLLRFSVTGLSGTVTRATLRLYVTDGSADGPRLFLTSGGWSESTVSWNTRPAPVGTALGDKGAVSTGTWMEYDVTSAVRGNGEVNLLLVATSADGTDVASRQTGTTSQRPQLVVTSDSETGTAQGAWRLPDAVGSQSGMVSIDPASQDLFVTREDRASGHGTWLYRMSSSGAVRWGYRLSPGPLTHDDPAGNEYQSCTMQVAADRKGGAYLAVGASRAPCNYRDRSFPDGTVWLAHVDGGGNVLALRLLTAPGPTGVGALAVDPAGNLVVGGHYYESTDLGAGPLPQATYSAGYVANYGPDLQMRWARKFDSIEGWESVPAIATGPDGEVLVGMHVDGAATYAGQPLPGAATRRAVLTMVNPDGTPRWMRLMGSDLSLRATHVSALGTAVTRTEPFEGPGSTLYTFERDGSPRWTKELSASVISSAIGADGALRLYFESIIDTDLGDGVLRGDGNHGYLVKLGLDGNVRWVQELPLTSFRSPALSLCASGTGQTFALGTYDDPQRFGDVTVPPASMPGVYLLRLAP